MTRICPLPGQPESGGEPVFDAPWQARAFVMAVHLNEQGVFSWAAWSERLAELVENHEMHAKIQNSDDYYRIWLKSLEAIAESLDWQNPA